MSATPRPWRVDGGKEGEGDEQFIYIKGGGDEHSPTIFVSSIVSRPGELERLQANADLIVRAVNSHEPLILALGVLADQAHMFMVNNGGGGVPHNNNQATCDVPICKAITAARAALALAEGSANE